MSTHEITSKVEHIRTLQSMIDELTAEMESVKDEVKAEMTAQGVDEKYFLFHTKQVLISYILPTKEQSFRYGLNRKIQKMRNILRIN